MRALRSFTVRPQLPPALEALSDLSMNLRWSWDQRTQDVFRWIDPAAWESSGHDPVRLLGLVGRARLEALADDRGFMSYLEEVVSELGRHVSAPQWFHGRKDSPLRAVAYFSPEFGIAEALPQYSGGLGVLAGDHLKASSSLGLPLVGVGLLYRQGYFRQGLNADGWQEERYPELDPHAMAVSPVEGVRIEVDVAGRPLTAALWRADVGRIRLYLLDTDIDGNDEDGRRVTDRLYGGGKEHRLRQEILLGIGGVRALAAVDEDVQVFHTNEGHAGFLGLERIRVLVTQHGLTFAEAIEAARAGTAFTTHTPVPAGIDEFPRELIETYFKGWCAEVGVTVDELMELGHVPGAEPTEPFNMAVMGLRLAGIANGVSKLHGEVSRAMFRGLWPDLAPDEVPITSVTNGVHATTWTAPEVDDLLGRHVQPTWWAADAASWKRVFDIRDDELWRVREQLRERLVSFVRDRLRAGARARGASSSDVKWCDEALDPTVLTIGFARRFASYKRATLLLSQPDRLKALLLSPDRPVQLVFAGKAHPADDIGKSIIRDLVAFTRDPEVRHRIAFVEDYDIAVARTMYQGSDVWLNTPRRPLEACGTSGEKAALNGVLNCSILDGWWDEMFDGENGWAISSADSVTDERRRDDLEAGSLFDLLEHQLVPLFYDRSGGRVPRGWVQRIKASLSSLGPEVVATRMVRDYVTSIYEPVAERADALARDGFARAKALAAWKERVRASWGAVRVVSVESEEGVADLGAERTVTAVVALGGLTTEDVAVELVHGSVGPNGELAEASFETMALTGLADGPGEYAYSGTCPCSRTGRYGFTVRVVPAHTDLASATELGSVAWA